MSYTSRERPFTDKFTLSVTLPLLVAMLSGLLAFCRRYSVILLSKVNSLLNVSTIRRIVSTTEGLFVQKFSRNDRLDKRSIVQIKLLNSNETILR